MTHRVVREAEGNTALCSAPRKLAEKYAAYLFKLFSAEFAEHYHVVDTVDEFRAELLFQRGHHISFSGVLLPGEAQRVP